MVAKSRMHQSARAGSPSTPLGQPPHANDGFRASCIPSRVLSSTVVPLQQPHLGDVFLRALVACLIACARVTDIVLRFAVPLLCLPLTDAVPAERR
eukprot:1141190-Pelagomonas_calceolata.AAC.3